MVNGKNKGNSFERLISKKLSLWASDNTRDDIFWRSENSGGRFTIRNKQNKYTETQDGDLACIVGDEKYRIFLDKISIECKSYKNINLYDFITGTSNGITSFWRQAKKQAEQSNKLPLLIVKKNNMPIIVFTDKVLHKYLMDDFNISELMSIKYKNEFIFLYKFEQIIELDYIGFVHMLSR
jgi:hypothetical protein